MQSPTYKIIGDQASNPSEGGIFGKRGSQTILNLSKMGSESEYTTMNDPYKSKCPIQPIF